MTAKYVFWSTQNCIKCFGAIPNNKEQTGHRTFQMHPAFPLHNSSNGGEYKLNGHQLQPKGKCIHTDMLYKHVCVLRVTPGGTEDAGLRRPLLERGRE